MASAGPRPHFAVTDVTQAAPKDSFCVISQNVCGLRAQCHQRLLAPPSKGQIVPLSELTSNIYGHRAGCDKPDAAQSVCCLCMCADVASEALLCVPTYVVSI